MAPPGATISHPSGEMHENRECLLPCFFLKFYVGEVMPYHETSIM